MCFWDEQQIWGENVGWAHEGFAKILFANTKLFRLGITALPPPKDVPLSVQQSPKCSPSLLHALQSKQSEQKTNLCGAGRICQLLHGHNLHGQLCGSSHKYYSLQMWHQRFIEFMSLFASKNAQLHHASLNQSPEHLLNALKGRWRQMRQQCAVTQNNVFFFFWTSERVNLFN